MIRPRLQVVQNDEIAEAIAVIRKHHPGLINDSMIVTSALIEYSISLESKEMQQLSNYKTPYGMTILRTGDATSETGIFRFLIDNFKHIAAIIAHIGSEDGDFIDYISRGKKPAYTFVFKGKGFTDFEFIHIATTNESLFEECLTLIVLDFKYYRDDIRFNLIRTKFFKDRWGEDISNYVPSLDKMAAMFFQDESYLFGGGGGQICSTWNLDWKAGGAPYNGLHIRDTRFVDYSHALVGLKESSLKEEKYGVEKLIRSGVVTINRDLLHRRFRCMCNGWKEEMQNLDLYELGMIFGEHFELNAYFSPARFLSEITFVDDKPNATVYTEKSKRIEVLPMNWDESWFTYYHDGKSSNSGWSLLYDDPNPFRLYDMNNFHPQDLERYKQQKKKPKEQ